MNHVKPRAEAVAIRGEKIVAVGSNEAMAPFIGKGTKIISLSGKTVVPGFIDTHAHVSDFGKLAQIDLKGSESIEEMKEKIRKDLEQANEGKWVLGMGWDQSIFREKRYPTRVDLDEVSPVNPIVLYHKSDCVCLLNSKALGMAGISKRTEAPSGGVIDKDAVTGEPTGILRDSATNLVWTKIPEANDEDLVETTQLALSRFVKVGITSLHWMVTSPVEIRVIERISKENKLPVRLYLIVHSGIMKDVQDTIFDRSFESKMVKLGGFQIFVDGSLAARTAALFQAYYDDPSTNGKMLSSQEELNALAAEIMKTNRQLVIHAMGDRGVDAALKAIAESSDLTVEKNNRPRIEHASLLSTELIRRIKELNVVLSVQPPSIISEFSVWSAIDRLGSERARWLFPLKTLLKEDVWVGAGSDCPMEPINPLIGIQVAMTRENIVEERIGADQALRMYTINAAYLASEENDKGSIESGKLADLVILSDDPTAVPPHEIESIKVDMTIVSGKIIWSKML
jgi:predicted amidohydrolase YtcJ